mmetsp:Transcript_16450/g.24099  ORF Transcript_16450/g.24099 Transcript_16450/m.24099 type:complete len:513 (-) Transcript_16450:36-1574(-)
MSFNKNGSKAAAVTGFMLGSAITTLVSLYLTRTTRTSGNNGTAQKSRSSSTSLSLSSASASASSRQNEKEIIIPPEIRSEQLSRNELYFGPAGMESIVGASILIVGLGGVGSHTAHMLARAGVGYLRLVDFDQVTLSSLNRHACATLEDVGIPKVECLKRFLYKVCGNHCDIDLRVQMYTGDVEKDGDMMTCPPSKGNGQKGKWDIVIDAIDDVPTKARLLAHCIKNDIRVISCMGAGGKSDMTRLHISDLKTASRDPLASKLRQTLKRTLKKDKDVKDLSFLEDVDQVAVIYSSEKVVVKLADFTEEQKKEGIHKFGAVDNMRIRVIPVLGTMPAIMGQSLAAMALCELGGKPFNPMSGERLGRNVRHKLFQHFKNRESKFRQRLEIEAKEEEDASKSVSDADETNSPRMINGSWVGPAQIDSDDVEYVFSEVWRNRCCVSGDTLGTVLELSRWDLSKPCHCKNIVLLGVKAMVKFDEAMAASGDGRNSVPYELRQKIEARLASCKVDSRA